MFLFSVFFPDPDPDPAIFVSDLQDGKLKIILKKEKFFAYYFLKLGTFT